MTSKVYVIKVILIGDGRIGKTSLARTITHGAFPSVGILSETDNQCLEYKCIKDTTITAGDNSYVIHIFDPDSDKTIQEYLPQADICYVCFDIINPKTFHSIKEKWLSLLKLKSKLILVGLKSDLKYDRAITSQLLLESPGLQPITHVVGHSLANELKASQYVEVSALKYLGIEQLKDKTVFDFVEHNDDQCVKGKRNCIVM